MGNADHRVSYVVWIAVICVYVCTFLTLYNGESAHVLAHAILSMVAFVGLGFCGYTLLETFATSTDVCGDAHYYPGCDLRYPTRGKPISPNPTAVIQNGPKVNPIK
nr:hypothetical protein [Salmonid herpesvirus 1]